MGTALTRLKAEGLWGFEEMVCKGQRATRRLALTEREWSQTPLSLISLLKSSFLTFYSK